MRLSSVRKRLLSALCGVFLIACLITPAWASDLTNVHYIGCGYIKGTAESFGDVEIYVPIDSKGKWGTTSNAGYLCNVSGSSISGTMYTSNGTEYVLICSSFSVPRVRLSTSSGYYDYQNLYVTIDSSNLQVATEFSPSVTMSEAIPLIIVGLLGVCILCLMRFRHS